MEWKNVGTYEIKMTKQKNIISDKDLYFFY
jgi:hypothetical protein